MKQINIRQHDVSDCGPTCLAIIAKYYKGKVSIAKLREKMGTNTEGTSLKGLIAGAESIGFKTEALKTIQNSADNIVDIPLPCISHMIVDGDLLHYVVILKVEKDNIVISDPGQGIVKLSRELFCKLEDVKAGDKQYRWTGILLILSPSNEFERSIFGTSRAEFLLKLIKPDTKICCFIIICSLLYTLINVGTAFYYKILIDKILPEYALQSLVFVSGAFLLLTIVKVVLNVLRVNMALVLGKHINSELSMGFYKHLLKLEQKFFDNRKVGELVSRFQDAALIQDLLSKVVLSVFVDIIAVIAAGVILYSQNREMFFGLMGICGLYVVVALLFRKKYHVYSKRQLMNEAQTMSGIVDFLNGILTVRLYNAKEYACKAVNQKFDAYLQSMYKLGNLENIQYGLKSWIGFTGEIIILGLGIVYIIMNRLTLGELITFNALIVYFFDPIRNLISLQAQLQTALVAAERIQEIMELDVENQVQAKCEEERDLSILKKDISFKGITFGYNTEKNVLQNFNLVLKGGAKVAIVGESGSGKSTIAKLIIKLYRPSEGSIFIGDMNIDKISSEWLREKVIYVSQETFMFNVSIMENLLLDGESISEEDVYSACKIAKIHQFIMKLPLQYHSVLEEGASNLSSGQKQRLMLARAILRRPYILVLDEAMSNLNFELEKIIDQSIKAYLPSTTIIIITHRASIARLCDNIYVLEDGVIKESGCHQELVRIKGRYCELLGQ